MDMLCRLNRHAQDGHVIENEGHHFSRCRRCSADLLEQGGKWVAAPKGFRIVWRSNTTADESSTSPLAKESVPAVVEASREPDRRQPGASPFLGPERRRKPDRRGRFGKVETLVEREGIRITRDGAAFPVASYRAGDILRVELAAQAGEVDLTWLLYSAVALLTASQAALTGEIGLWALAVAIGGLASVKWQKRQGPDRYAILVEGGGGLTPVLQTSDKSFATLVHDALAAIQGQPAMNRL
ncbi:MAG: DUF6232 family protein [Allosphingosinicella sp.]